MKLSVVIPAYNEAESLPETIEEIYKELVNNKIEHEILVINDSSADDTVNVIETLQKSYPTINYITNQAPNGFGYAVRKGLDNFEGDAVAIMMADLSVDPKDLVKFYNEMKSGNYDCVFGNRWTNGGKVYDYPKIKRIINRIANFIIKVTFQFRYNDTTNAFKLYKKETIEGLKPFLSPHFNLTIELPLKAIIRGYSYSVVPNSWKNRKYGESNLKIREMGTRYFFIMLYCLIEKFFSKGDFNKKWN